MPASSFALLIPIFVLLVGALAVLLFGRLMGPRRSGFLASLIAGGALLSLLLLVGRLPSSFVLSHWRPLMGGNLTCKIDSSVLLFAITIVLLGLASILSSLDGGMEANFYVALLVLPAAGLGFVFSANLITLCFGWIFLEIALLLGEMVGVGGRSPAGRMAQALGVFALLAAALLAGCGLSLDSPLPSRALLLVALAGLLRVGIYPLRFWEPDEVRPQALPYLISTGTGLYLLICFGPSGRFLVGLGLLAFLMGAVLAWIKGGSLYFIAASQVGYAVLTAAVARPVAPAINLLLCLGLLFNRGKSEEKPWQRAPLALALASLAGLPFTLGFVGYWLLLYVFHYSLIFLIPCLLAEVSLSAALFKIWFSPCPSERSPRASLGTSQLAEESALSCADRGVRERPTPISPVAHLASSVFLATPLLLFGLFPSLIREEVLPAPFRSMSISLWAALLLPPLGGYLLYRWRRVPSWLSTRLAAVFELGWFYDALNWFLAKVEAILLGMAKVLEGEGYLGWALLAVLLALLFLWSR
ncbi:MAG: hypothetical protein U9R11_00985 [Chloroflexota bacterium]|nr:hypothetical protein [Chloroflexota bacterium]